MTAKDQLKVINQGFTIIRTESIHIVSHNWRRVIKAKTKDHQNWHTIESGFESEAALKRRMAELLKGELTVED